MSESKSKPQIGVVDYGAGNLFSIRGGLEAAGARVALAKTAEEIAACDALVVPGVGAFGPAMAALEPLRGAIAKFAESGKPLLGVCLGMQVFFERSDESPGIAGFGFFKGRVTRFPASADGARVRVPQIGWNSLEVKRRCPLLEEIESGERAYFANSYYAASTEKSVVAAETDYGVRFAAAVWRRGIFATQFHPEKSGATGLKILRNFVELARK